MTKSSEFKVYLSGSIKKGSSDPRPSDRFWTEADESVILGSLGAGTLLLNPAKTAISRQDYLANYGCDLFLVKSSEVVLVDLRHEKGIGVGAEMMFANYFGVPVVGWVPRDSYYHRSHLPGVFGEDLTDWTHPFVFGMCDEIEESLDGACLQLKKIREEGWAGRQEAKTPERVIERFLALYPEFQS